MRLWLYRDFADWHKSLGPVLAARGHDVRSFSEAHEPDHGAVFGRIHHDPKVRDRDKAVWAELALNPDLDLIPHYRASVLYDDKAEQARQLCRWMPRTAIATSEADAVRAIAEIGLPLISKTAEGAGSHNVRLIDTRAKAMAEARKAFGKGLPVYAGQVQQGYVLWQAFCDGNDNDFRVIRVGDERLILRRGNRADRPMASGSGRERPIRWPDDEAAEVLAFANSFFAEEAMTFCGVDIVRDHDEGRWVILECTTGWPLGKNKLHNTVSGRPWIEFFEIIADQLEAGAL